MKRCAVSFTVAPNKNSLYGENMPYYDSLKVSSDKNLVNLQKYLRQDQVSYGDLYETLSERERSSLSQKRFTLEQQRVLQLRRIHCCLL